jgi:hypothetical protein
LRAPTQQREVTFAADVAQHLHNGRRVSSRVVTIVADDERGRADLAGYLQRSGFDVRLLDRKLRASHVAPSVVWLTERNGDPSTVAEAIDAWLGASDGRCAVVITWRPSAFRALHELHGVRIAVLAAPVFGWQVVDALRASHHGGPA